MADEEKTKEQVIKGDKKFDGIVFIGGKDFMNYVNAVEWQLRDLKEVVIKARGKYTSKAIDVSQVMENRYNYKIGEVKITSEEFDNDEKTKKIRVSTIEIVVHK